MLPAHAELSWRSKIQKHGWNMLVGCNMVQSDFCTVCCMISCVRAFSCLHWLLYKLVYSITVFYRSVYNTVCSLSCLMLYGHSLALVFLVFAKKHNIVVC